MYFIYILYETTGGHFDLDGIRIYTWYIFFTSQGILRESSTLGRKFNSFVYFFDSKRAETAWALVSRHQPPVPTPHPAGVVGWPSRLSGNGDLDLDAGVNVDNDLLDDLGGGVEVDEALVDAHLEAVPGLGALTAGGLAGGDLERLGGQADGALCAEVLVLGAVDDLGADLLEDLDLAGGQGDADLVALL